MCFEEAFQGQEVEATVSRVMVVAVEHGDRGGQRAPHRIATCRGLGGEASCHQCRQAGFHLGRVGLSSLKIGAAIFPALPLQMQ